MSHIYWAEEDTQRIRRMPFGGGTINIITTSTGTNVRAIAVDDTNQKIYFGRANTNVIYQAEIATDSFSSFHTATGHTRILSLSLDPNTNHLYYIADDGSTIPYTSHVRRVNLDGSGDTLIANYTNSSFEHCFPVTITSY